MTGATAPLHVGRHPARLRQYETCVRQVKAYLEGREVEPERLPKPPSLTQVIPEDDPVFFLRNEISERLDLGAFHSLNIDFTNEAEGAPVRVAVELTADSARALVAKILAALAAGEASH